MTENREIAGNIVLDTKTMRQALRRLTLALSSLADVADVLTRIQTEPGPLWTKDDAVEEITRIVMREGFTVGVEMTMVEAEQHMAKTEACPACDDGKRWPEQQDQLMTLEDNSVQVFCAACGRCIQA